MRKPVINLAVGFAVFAACGLANLPAQAALGAKAASVESDRSHLHARMASREAPNYTVQELTLDSGTVVHEYTLDNGTVFAVSWEGATRPDLRQLFGGYFARFQADNATHKRGRLYSPLSSDHTDFVVRSGGHSGDFWGYAVLPQQIPVGFTAANVQQ